MTAKTEAEATDPKPMTDEKLAAIQAALQKAKHNAPPMLLETVAEILCLRAREKVLREALRARTIANGSGLRPRRNSGELLIALSTCDCGAGAGETSKEPEHHAPNCPAAPLEDQR